MHVSAKTEYACIAMLELAASFTAGEPVQLRRIAKSHGIPSRFLVQILLQLKNAGLVSSTRGAAGGYRLARNPADISMLDVVEAIEGGDTSLTSNTSPPSIAAEILIETWSIAADRQREVLRATNFAELAERASGETEDMYYI